MTVAIIRRAGRREWAGLAVLTLPCLLYAMDLTVLNLAVPAISKSLRPSGVELLWIVDIYGFVLAGSLAMGVLPARTACAVRTWEMSHWTRGLSGVAPLSRVAQASSSR